MARYTDVASDLKSHIEQGRYPVGSVLPAERELALDYGISRGAVRNALAALARRGLVAPRHGVGWVVQSADYAQDFAGMLSFGQWADQHGLRPSGRIVSSARRYPTDWEAAVLDIPTTREVYTFARLRFLGDQLVMIERSVWSPAVADIVAALPDDVASVTDALADAGLPVSGGAHRIDAVAATSEDARVLGVRRASPLLRVRRTMTAGEGVVVEYGEDRYLPGTVSFDVVASRSANVVDRALA